MPTFCPGGTFASFLLNFSKNLASVPSVRKYNNLYKKYIRIMTFASFESRTMLANVPLYKYMFFELLGDIRFGLPGPFQTAFELTN